LTARKPEAAAPPSTPAAKAPEPLAKIERPGVAIAMSPQDRGSVTSHDEDELEIPAFLRRQAN
jgi:hypothetical protein